MAEPTVTSIGSGAYRVTHAGRTRVAYAAGPADARWVFFEGRVHVVNVEDRSAEALRHHDLAVRRKRRDVGALTAPMPATVASIHVEPGQRVSKGDLLIMLEAMKMELPLKAPHDGTVTAIACRAGELVQPGVPLLELT